MYNIYNNYTKLGVKMKKSTKIIIGCLAALVVGGIGFAIFSSAQKSAEMEKYSEWDIIEGNNVNGNIADHVIGNKDAKVKVIEYADFQCSACATTFPYIHEIIDEYKDQVALVFRTYVINYHQNGTAAATAATAAGLQGYFDEYATLLFANQNEWYDAEGTNRDEIFKSYLEDASNGEADVKKYTEDLKSSAVKEKIAFDRALALRVKLSATPLIYINQEKYEVASAKESEFKADFKAKLEEAINKAYNE